MAAQSPIESLANVNHHPLVKQKMSELRNQKTDPKRFRELVREIGALLGYEATKGLMLTEVPNVALLLYEVCTNLIVYWNDGPLHWV